MSAVPLPDIAIDPIDPRVWTAVRKHGSLELLRAVHRHPGQALGAYWSGCGVPLLQSTIASRLRWFARHGLITDARELTALGRSILEAHEL